LEITTAKVSSGGVRALAWQQPEITFIEVASHLSNFLYSTVKSKCRLSDEAADEAVFQRLLKLTVLQLGVSV
jgi:hypothetical protein